MGILSRLRRQPVEETALSFEEIQAEAIEGIKEAIDVINNLLPLLPRGMYLYVDRSEYPRKLQLCAYEGEFVILHGDD